MAAAEVKIRPYLEVPQTQGGIEEIFFASSATQSFESDQARAAFLERWLGRYLSAYPADAFVAVDTAGKAAGYIVGCLDEASALPLFRDIAYLAYFRDMAREYPAHLHINAASPFRNRGIGARLIEAFATHAAAHGCPGIHAVTADGSRNNPFYLRCGFIRAATAVVGGVPLVFFARRLGRGTG